MPTSILSTWALRIMEVVKLVAVVTLPIPVRAKCECEEQHQLT